jgi:hypothetical protein
MDMKRAEELAPPPGIRKAERAMELARIWIVDKKLQVRLSGNLWEDPVRWGLLLVDLARHISLAYESQGRNAGTVLRRIRDGLDMEWGHPTDVPEQLEPPRDPSP